MSFSLLHPILAGLGIGAVVAPIIIHLLFRQKPRPIIFPALMLLRPTQKQSVRRVRIRHWLLLAMRCLLVALLGLAMARPTVRSALFAIDQEAPIAAVMVFDDSPSMALAEMGSSRLEVAQELAIEALRRMPEGSRVEIIPASGAIGSAPIDLANAESRISALEIQPSPRSLHDALLSALRNLSQSTNERRELYVFSDFAVTSWNLPAAQSVSSAAELLGADATVYLVNVSAERREDIAIDDLELATDRPAEGASLSLQAVITNRGPEVENTVRVVVDETPRGEKPIRVPAGETVRVTFELAGLEEGFHQGTVSLAAHDALPFNDVRFFSVEVRQPVAVLTVADAGESRYWIKALSAPAEDGSGSGMRVEWTSPDELHKRPLHRYAALCLLNVPSLPPAEWTRITDYVQQGGGLFVSLGPRTTSDEYNSGPAQQVLAGQLVEVVSAEVFLAPDQLTHPVLERFAELGGTDFADWPVFKYWRCQPAETTSVIAKFSNGSPCLMERSFGQGRGRSLLMTTTTHYDPKGDSWNDIPLGWSYVVLAEQMMKYLAGSGTERLNHSTGETVSVARRAGDPFTLYAVTDPVGDVERVAIEPRDVAIVIPSTRQAGHYKIDATQAGAVFHSAFSVNVPQSESELEPLDLEKLSSSFGSLRTTLVRKPDDLAHVEGTARVGREMFPWIMLLVAILVVGEGFLANRFYRERKG